MVKKYLIFNKQNLGVGDGPEGNLIYGFCPDESFDQAMK
jgi:hypothetical protein